MDALSRESEEWTLASDKKLLDWMQAFTTRVERRCHGVGSRIDLLLAQVKALDASLQNTCNHFSSLSSSQYLENRIAEEDEVVVRANPADAAQQPLPSVGVTEADIHSRYRRATHVALQAVQSAVEQTQEVMRSGAQRLPLMHAKGAVSFEGPLRPLPYIIGSAAYANDSACGLAEAAGNRGGGFRGAPAPSRQLREENNTWNYSENLSQSLEEGRSGAGSADMAFNAKVARQFGDDTRQADGQSVSGNRSRNGHVASPGATSSGTAGAEIRVVEPAVSTVDGFRAMLEAALRGPADLCEILWRLCIGERNVLIREYWKETWGQGECSSVLQMEM